MENGEIVENFINKLFNNKESEIKELIYNEFSYFQDKRTEQEILSSIINSYLYNEMLIEDDVADIKKNIEISKKLKESEELKKYYIELNYYMIEEIMEFKNRSFRKKVIQNANDLLFFGKIIKNPFDKGYCYDMYKLYCNPNRDRTILASFQYIKEENYRLLETTKNTNVKKYIEKLDLIIRIDSTLEEILRTIQENHILKKREEIFKQIIKFFNEKNWELVINLIAIQIEGIFFDYIRFKEMNETKKSTGSLKEKINFAQDIYKIRLTPFMIFDFSKIRNTIAHDGVMAFDNIEITAKELIIICKNLLNMFKGVFLPYNNLVFFCNEIIKDDKNEDIEAKVINTLCIFDSVLNNGEDTDVYEELLNLEKYKNIFEGYILENGENVYEYAKKIFEVLRSEKFWNMLCRDVETTEDLSIEDIKFLQNFSKKFIGIFDENSSQKNNIINILKKLKEIEKLEKLIE